MPSITYTQPNGNQQTLQVEEGTTLMRAAVNNGIDGIIGECGGQAMCATCHVYVRPEHAQALPEISDDEDEMLDCTTAELACFPLFWMINTGSLPMLYLAMTIFTVGLGLAYGPQAALYSEMFPASVRFSGVSISYALGAILGGAFAPTIATALVQATGGTDAVSLYLVGMTLVSLLAVSLVRDRSGIDLSIRNQAEQEVGALVYDRRTASVSNEPVHTN